MAQLSLFILATCSFTPKIAYSGAYHDDFNQFNLRNEYSKSEVSVEASGHETVRDHVFRETAAGLATRVDLMKKDRAPPDHDHEVVFAVQQQNLEELTRILHDISDPDSENYGQHKTREMIEELTSNPTSREAILKCLLVVGATVTSESIYGEYITARAPIAVWESLFDTEFFSFHHSKAGTERVTEVMRAERYSVPKDLHEHVASVFHTVQMPLAIWGRPIMELVENYTSSIQHLAVTGVVTPPLLNSYYSINSNTGSLKASQAVFETIGQYFSPDDLQGFQQYYGLPEQPVSTFIGGHVSDTICTTSPETCMEANLDVQYMMAVCQKSPTTHWYTDENSFSNWLIAVANNRSPPSVISISYGASEGTVTASELNAFNTQAIKLGAMGITVLAASGDDGAVSFSARGDKSLCAYMPLFPASSPYVTAVGATQGPESGTAEVTCQRDLGGSITSGGGFSAYFPQQSWQSAVVAAYFKNVVGTAKAPVKGYQPAGRGYPDISLVGTNYMTQIGGDWYAVSGTSASSPAFAAMITLINSARISLGKSTVGWLNPTLYGRRASYVKDITSGRNNCGVGNYDWCCSQGFYAAPGWDPATGLGSINFNSFKNVLVSLGSAPSSPTFAPTRAPTKTAVPSIKPSNRLSNKPSIKPSNKPSIKPSIKPASNIQSASSSSQHSGSLKNPSESPVQDIPPNCP